MGQFEEMQNFVRVVEAGSISKAADQLGVAKSGVSRRLAELDWHRRPLVPESKDRWGVRIVARAVGAAKLAAAGLVRA